MASSWKMLQNLMEVEETAEEILADRQQIVDLDRRRQQTREAVRCLRKDQSAGKSWVCFGNMFIKLPKKQARELLEKDHKELDKEIDTLRKNLKPKVEKLRDQEGKDKLTGFNLQPLSADELKAINRVL